MYPYDHLSVLFIFFLSYFLTWPKQHTTTSRTDVTGVYFLQLVSGKTVRFTAVDDSKRVDNEKLIPSSHYSAAAEVSLLMAAVQNWRLM